MAASLKRGIESIAQIYSGRVEVNPLTRPSRARWRRLLHDSEGALLASVSVLVLMTTIAIASIWTQTDHPLWAKASGTVMALVTTITFGTLQSRLVPGLTSRRLSVIGVLVILLGIGAVYVSDTWTLLGVSSATALLIVRRYGWLAALAVIVAGSAFINTSGASLAVDVGVPVISVVVATALLTLTRLAQALVEVRISREKLARLQVDSERNRISRDLHDIVGRTMIATSLRLQSAIHLLDRDLDRTREQLEHAQRALNEGQAELRSLTRGPMPASLTDELHSARVLCARLGIRLDVDVPAHELEPEQALAARVVREGVTNMLKHSRPLTCRIRIAATEPLDITLTNDGCPPPLDDDPAPGTGLIDLQRRVRSAGLELTAHRVGVQGYRLHVGPAPQLEESP